MPKLHSEEVVSALRTIEPSPKRLKSREYRLNMFLNLVAHVFKDLEDCGGFQTYDPSRQSLAYHHFNDLASSMVYLREIAAFKSGRHIAFFHNHTGRSVMAGNLHFYINFRGKDGNNLVAGMLIYNTLVNLSQKFNIDVESLHFNVNGNGVIGFAFKRTI